MGNGGDMYSIGFFVRYEKPQMEIRFRSNKDNWFVMLQRREFPDDGKWFHVGLTLDMVSI